MGALAYLVRDNDRAYVYVFTSCCLRREQEPSLMFIQLKAKRIEV
jgi:hypothetical protein